MNYLNRYIMLTVSVLLMFSVKGQFKTTYKIDASDVTNVASMKIVGMHDVRKGNERVLLVGDYSGKDNLNNSISPFYSIETSYEGDGWISHYYKDANLSAPIGTRAYGSVYDANSGLYVGGSSDVNQTVSRIDAAGNVVWTLNTGHHEIHSLLFDTTLNHLVVLGQGESITNIHDFYVAIIDTNGNLLKGYNYGNTGFELPSTILQTSTGYLAVGTTYNSPFKDILLLSLDTGLTILWSKTYNRSSYIEHVVKDAVKVEGKEEYSITGYIKGAGANPDSAFYFSVDGLGNPLQYKVLMTDTAMDVHANAIMYNSDLKNFIIGGNFSPEGTNYTQPFIMQCDSNGGLIWAKAYGEGVDSTSETIEEVLWVKDSSFFLAVGNYLYQDGGGTYHWEVFMLKDEYTNQTSPCNATLDMLSYNRTMQVQQTGMMLRENYFFSAAYNLLSVETGIEEIQKECEIPVSVHQLRADVKQEILVYPNPANHKITIEGLENIISVDIIDTYGRVVLTKKYATSSTSYFKDELDISHLSKGMYVVVARMGKRGIQYANTLMVTSN